MTMNRLRNQLFLVFMIVLLGIGVFLFFKSFYDTNPSNLATEILAALLGSIITVMITMLLIRQQGNVEQAEERATANKTAIFNKKLELFQQFISSYTKSAMDGRLDRDELGNMEELAMTITLLSRPTMGVPAQQTHHIKDLNLGQLLCRFVLQLQVFGLATEVTKEQHTKYDEVFRPLRLPDNAGKTRRLITIDEVLRLMKAELLIEQTADEDVADTDDEPKSTDFRWAQRLLNYRAYRESQGTTPGSEPGNGNA